MEGPASSITILLHFRKCIVPLGIPSKSETSHDQIIDIMEHLQQYAPVISEVDKLSILGVGEKEVHADKFHHLMFGGDQLNAKRARGSQHVRSNSIRGIDEWRD